jgi:hypothetical protein
MSEQIAGAALDREEAAKIEGFRDLWKVQQDRATVRNVYAFHDCFASLVFGQSLSSSAVEDGRVRSHLFCGGTGAKVALFNRWLGALDGAHFSVRIDNSLFGVLAWLCHEQTPCDTKELARDWFNMRAPSAIQLAIAQAVFEGFLLGKNSWAFWEHVGDTTRAAIDHNTLEVWRTELAKRYSAITMFHDTLRSYFLREVSSHGHGHQQFEAAAHRRYVDREAHRLVNRASQIAAQVVEETAQGSLVARFENQLLCEGKAVSAEEISERLAAAFSGTHFNVEVQAI